MVDIGRPWGIEWYGDINSTIRHNTVVYRASGCEYGMQCGYIAIDCRSSEFNCGNNAAYGTQVYDNIATVTVADGAKTARNDHNSNGPQVTFQGGSSPPPRRRLRNVLKLSSQRLARQVRARPMTEAILASPDKAPIQLRQRGLKSSSGADMQFLTASPEKQRVSSVTLRPSRDAAHAGRLSARYGE